MGSPKWNRSNSGSSSNKLCGRENAAESPPNVLLRKLDFGLAGEADGRRLEVVADGLPLNWQSTPQWSVLCTVTGGPDRVQPTHWEWLWSGGAKSAKQVGGVRSGSRGPLGRGNPKTSSANWPQVWRLRWGSMVSCVVARAVADSLLGLPRALGADVVTPLVQDVNGICWHLCCRKKKNLRDLHHLLDIGLESGVTAGIGLLLFLPRTAGS